MLIALHTAPGNSWANPFQRLLSIVYLGLKGVGVMRPEGSSTQKAILKPANNMKAVRAALQENSLEEEWRASIESTI